MHIFLAGKYNGQKKQRPTETPTRKPALLRLTPAGNPGALAFSPFRGLCLTFSPPRDLGPVPPGGPARGLQCSQLASSERGGGGGGSCPHNPAPFLYRENSTASLSWKRCLLPLKSSLSSSHVPPLHWSPPLTLYYFVNIFSLFHINLTHKCL